ncbi:MAG: hypothetical protein SGARI_001889 [Bacillariaceae sp.]
MTDTSVELSNGVRMPLLALGTAPLCADPGTLATQNPRFVGFLPEQASRIVHLGLQAGIRHIDTALMYRTQPKIAGILEQWFADGRLRREDVFLTTKVYHPPAPSFATDDSNMDMDNMSVDQVADTVRTHFQRCITELGVGYVDLMLLHWPGSGGGLNTKVHLEHLMEDGARHRPMVNQLETSVYIRHDRIVEYCKEKGIVVQAYSPFGRGVNNLLEDPVVQSVAKKHKKTPGQIALRYIIQQGIAPIFLSSSEERITSNLESLAFELDGDDMHALASLQKKDGGSWGLPSPYSIS